MKVDDDALQVALDGVRYPCRRADLLRHAAAHGSDDATLGRLSALPEDGEYDGLSAVRAALVDRC